MENARNVGSVITPRANQGFPKNLRGREKGSRIRSVDLLVRKGRTRTRIMIHLRLGANTLFTLMKTSLLPVEGCKF